MSRDNFETTGNESRATKQYVSCGAVYHAIQLVWFKVTSMWLWSCHVKMKAIQARLLHHGVVFSLYKIGYTTPKM